MLNQSSLTHLQNAKNLLAFSAGVDSTALFFLLLDSNIPFDIAIVNYNIRKQSKEEVAYAQSLAIKHNLKCHLLNAPSIRKNFEANARQIRYDFFEELITTQQYNNLLTAHHLGDRFEWMLMQFCKGAGCIELAGMKTIEKRKDYSLVRPLLGVDKSELLEYLRKNALQYFEDETNTDERITRNAFRHQHGQPLLKKYLQGIKNSFRYIDADNTILDSQIQVLAFKDIHYFPSSSSIRTDIITLDKYFKRNNYLLSAAQRALLKKEDSVILGRKYLVTKMHNYIYISPYKVSNVSMPKDFKEECRILKINTKMRSYLYENKEVFIKVKELLFNT